MEKPISPWTTETVRLESPDGRKVAILTEPGEIGMGAPTSGELKVSNGQYAESCNPSMVWSDDSRFLAVPQWFDRMQRLVILDTDFKKRAFAPETYRVLELHSFDMGIVEGVDSPVHQPRRVAFDIRSLFANV
jgi:hypothetical protein